MSDIQRCFKLGKMKGLTHLQFSTYSSATYVFERIQSINSNVSTLRSAGDKSVRYYQFQTADEQAMYTMGQRLLIQNDPDNASSYFSVQKN